MRELRPGEIKGLKVTELVRDITGMSSQARLTPGPGLHLYPRLQFKEKEKANKQT